MEYRLYPTYLNWSKIGLQCNPQEVDDNVYVQPAGDPIESEGSVVSAPERQGLLKTFIDVQLLLRSGMQ